MKTKTLFLVTFLMLAGMACASRTVSNADSNGNAAVNTNAEPSGTPSSGGGETQSAAAEALVADLYKQHNAKRSPFFQTKNRALVDKYFTKTLADLIWRDATSSKGEVGAIDGDPLYNAQDTDIKNFSIGKASVLGDAATVPVTFANFGEKQTLTFALRSVKGSWRIENIQYGEGDSLMKWLKDTYPDKGTGSGSGTGAATTPNDGEFEGRYQVGDTSCTVAPAKMSFEVRWAKGTGVETFFFKDGTTFESAAADNSNRFLFDDETYARGTFYRADGKSFPVKRIK